MKFLTALLATFALSITQPAYAQVYTQQEINYLNRLEEAFQGEVPSTHIQKTIPYAHGICDLLREGYSVEHVLDMQMSYLSSAVRDGELTVLKAAYTAFITGASIGAAQQELCPDVR